MRCSDARVNLSGSGVDEPGNCSQERSGTRLAGRHLRARTLGGGFAVEREPGVDGFDGPIDLGVAHAELRADHLH